MGKRTIFLDGKICNRCKSKLPLSSFRPHLTQKYRASCLSCERAERKARWQLDERYREAILERTRLARLKNPEENKARSARYWGAMTPEQLIFWRSRKSFLEKQRRHRVRWAVINHYSNGNTCCACCGERTPEFLCLDHIEGGGTLHRKITGATGSALYHRLERLGFPPGFQILCSNCNAAKGHYGKCPHVATRGAWKLFNVQGHIAI